MLEMILIFEEAVLSKRDVLVLGVKREVKPGVDEGYGVGEEEYVESMRSFREARW